MPVTFNHDGAKMVDPMTLPSHMRTLNASVLLCVPEGMQIVAISYKQRFSDLGQVCYCAISSWWSQYYHDTLHITVWGWDDSLTTYVDFQTGKFGKMQTFQTRIGIDPLESAIQARFVEMVGDALLSENDTFKTLAGVSRLS